MTNKNIMTLAAALIFATVMGWWVSLPSKPVAVTVSDNASAAAIGETLHKARLITSKTVFRVVVKLTGNSKSLKAGTYMISPRTSVFGIVARLASGKGTYERVTIPEGFTAAEIAEALAARKVVDKDRFTAAVKERKLEGYLFPDTYYFDRGLSETVVIDKMLREFEKNFTPAMAGKAEGLKMSREKIVTLASIIEKEARRAEERPLIAGVFYNRLRKGWFLESCATVQYALGGHKPKLSYKDLKVDSPYNTYKFYGLPPGPICSPGKASLDAALEPAGTDDMFFVVSDSGAHTFSRYYSDHIKNKRKKGAKAR